MVDVDGIARDAAQGVIDSASQVDLPEMSDVRSSRTRRNGVAAVAGAFVLTLVVVGSALIGGGSSPEGTEVAVLPTTVDVANADGTTVETRTAVLHMDAVDGVEIGWPSGWEQASETLTPSRSDPLELFSIANFPLSAEQGICEPFPRQAVVDFPGDGGFLTLRERFRNIDAPFAARPAAFGPGAPQYVLPEGDCLDTTERGDIGSINLFEFSEGNRSFELLVVLGIAASETTIADAWEIANSLTVEPRRPADAVAAPDTLFFGNVFVIDPGDGPRVCAGGVAESLPPLCGGPHLDGLNWNDVPWAETAQGATWAPMHIVVRVGDGRLVLAAPPSERQDIESSPMDVTPVPNVDLQGVMDDIGSLKVTDWPPGIFWVSGWGIIPSDGVVDVTALIVTPEGQQWLDDRYGKDVVRATSMLHPVEETSFG